MITTASQQIIKLAPAIFRSFWMLDDDKFVVGSELKLNFQPIIDEYKLTGEFVLIHWQARPKGLRRWGLYDGATDQYVAADADKVAFVGGELTNLSLLQIDEKIINSVPTAVLALQNCSFTVTDGYVFVSKMEEHDARYFVDN